MTDTSKQPDDASPPAPAANSADGYGEAIALTTKDPEAHPMDLRRPHAPDRAPGSHHARHQRKVIGGIIGRDPQFQGLGKTQVLK